MDGVFLDLHGAGVVEHLEDLEGDLCAAVRDLVGEAVPITAAFDLHGNVTQQMADSLDGVFACHQYPHIDMHLRAAEGIQLIDVAGKLSSGDPCGNFADATATTTTFGGIGETFLAQVLEEERNSRAISSTSAGFTAFPIPTLAMSAVTLLSR